MIVPQVNVPAKINLVKDGDTVNAQITINVDVRLLDCWAKELKSKDKEERKLALAAKRRLYQLLFEGGSLTEWPTSKTVMLNIPLNLENFAEMFTFGRVLAHVWDDDIKVGDVLVEEGLATKNKEL